MEFLAAPSANRAANQTGTHVWLLPSAVSRATKKRADCSWMSLRHKPRSNSMWAAPSECCSMQSFPPQGPDAQNQLQQQQGKPPHPEHLRKVRDTLHQSLEGRRWTGERPKCADTAVVVKTQKTPGEHQDRWQMDVPPHQNGGIGYAPWPYLLPGFLTGSWGRGLLHRQDTGILWSLSTLRRPARVARFGMERKTPKTTAVCEKGMWPWVKSQIVPPVNINPH